MTVYRVGPEGALVLDEDEHVVARLRPGLVVVPGPSSGRSPGTPPSEPPSYDDKVVRPRRRTRPAS